ncbi:hypothetical protein [Halobacillus salinus]|uniref:Uncharacterized protein n=1 Tax=Halobacillus salinus TaxID=192814 RepID=A0A4Z0H423_9BACI|nr:hypothetical protein [Halobacillus salinus]TGB04860.1 hypothetical protein E4663_07660 [Halobacillus salinus]
MYQTTQPLLFHHCTYTGDNVIPAKGSAFASFATEIGDALAIYKEERQRQYLINLVHGKAGM